MTHPIASPTLPAISHPPSVAFPPVSRHCPSEWLQACSPPKSEAHPIFSHWNQSVSPAPSQTYPVAASALPQTLQNALSETAQCDPPIPPNCSWNSSARVAVLPEAPATDSLIPHAPATT